jgi:UDP-glucose:(heptosyl)LPS alpha-1,3-glucosyltransferase
MRVGLVLRRLSTHGGTERFTTGFVRWLLAQGHGVDVWCAGVDELPEGARFRPLDAGGRGRIWRMHGLAQAAARVPVAEYDGVLNQIRGPVRGTFRAGGGCHGAWVQARGWSLADGLETRLDRQAIDSALSIVVNSEMAGADLQRCYGVDPDRISLVRNGVDLSRFVPSRSGEPLDLVFLGSGFARKGLRTAIEALVHLAGRRLTVLGADRQTERYARLARELGVGDRVEFLGAVDCPESYLARARCLVLPTLYDPSANACLEAMACGVPVVTTRSNGAAEVLPEPWMAIADPRDDCALAEVLGRVLEDQSLGAACRAAAERYPAAGAYQALWKVMEATLG